MANSSARTRTIVLGFVAGVLAVLMFHQIASSLVNMRPGWNFATKIPPFGVPQIINQCFWGGVWGIVFAWLEPRFQRGFLYYVTATAFGAVLLPLVAWYVVPLLKGGVLGPRNSVVNSMIINGAWGLGMGVFYTLLTRRRW